jgi:hypothetical protein
MLWQSSWQLQHVPCSYPIWAQVLQYLACWLNHCSRSRCSSSSCIRATPCSVTLRSPTLSLHPSNTINSSTCIGLCLHLALRTRRTHALFGVRLLPSMWSCATAARVTSAGYLLLLQPPMRPPPYLLRSWGPPWKPRALRAGWWAL